MRQLLTAALAIAAAPALALPPVVPPSFAGMADLDAKESSCVANRAFMFQANPRGTAWRIVVTSPPDCWVNTLTRVELVVVQPTALGSLWVLPLRTTDPGQNDGPNIHMMPGNPADQAQMRWGWEERAHYTVSGRWLDADHFEVSYRLYRPQTATPKN